MVRLLNYAILLCLIAGCAQPVVPDLPTPTNPINTLTTVNGVTVAEGYGIDVWAEGFNGLTQMIVAPDGRLWVAQINGDENASTGQLVALDRQTGERTVLLDGLLKPTGIALIGDQLWIATRRELNRATVAPDGTIGAVEPILTELPFNGRSNGTLTITPDGLLLYETSGARQGNAAAPGSGTLWQLDPNDPTHPQALATGLKGAYAHTFDQAGRLWTTEIGDDLVNGAAPPDELNLVVPSANFGWPLCFDRGEAATNYTALAKRSPVTAFQSAFAMMRQGKGTPEAKAMLAKLGG